MHLCDSVLALRNHLCDSVGFFLPTWVFFLPMYYVIHLSNEQSEALSFAYTWLLETIFYVVIIKCMCVHV